MSGSPDFEGEACKAIFWPTPGLKFLFFKWSFDSHGLPAGREVGRSEILCSRYPTSGYTATTWMNLLVLKVLWHRGIERATTCRLGSIQVTGSYTANRRRVWCCCKDVLLFLRGSTSLLPLYTSEGNYFNSQAPFCPRDENSTRLSTYRFRSARGRFQTGRTSIGFSFLERHVQPSAITGLDSTELTSGYPYVPRVFWCLAGSWSSSTSFASVHSTPYK